MYLTKGSGLDCLISSKLFIPALSDIYSCKYRINCYQLIRGLRHDGKRRLLNPFIPEGRLNN